MCIILRQNMDGGKGRINYENLWETNVIRMKYTTQKDSVAV